MQRGGARGGAGVQGASNACARSDTNVQRAVSSTGVQRVCKGGLRGAALVCNDCAKGGAGVQGVSNVCARSDTNVQRAVSSTGVQRVCKGGGARGKAAHVGVQSALCTSVHEWVCKAG